MPKGWDVRSLADIAQITSGGTPSRTKSEYWEHGTIPWIRTTEVQNCILNPDDTQEYISEIGLKNSSAKFVPAGTVLLAMIGQGKTRGQVALLKFEATTNQNCAAIIFNNDQEPEFHFNFLLSQYENIRGMSNSAGQSNLSGSLVKAIKVPVPPLSEQKKIAKILSAWDKAITTTEQLLANSQQQKKALMQQLLTGKKRMLDNNGVRFSGEWSSYLLEELEGLRWVELGRGNVISKKDIADIPGDYPIYSSSIKNNGLMGKYGEYMFDEELISWSVDGGGNFFYRPKHKFSVTNVSGYMRLNPEKLNYQFIAAQLELHHSRLEFDYQSKAHPSVIRKAYILTIPSLDEQTKIAAVLSTADQKISALQQKLDALKQEKKALMQQLLTGKRRVLV